MSLAKKSQRHNVPVRVMALVIGPIQTGIGGAGNWTEERMRFGVAITCIRESGRWTRYAVHTLESAAQAHALIAEQTPKRGCLYVYAVGMARVASLIGLWDRIRIGEYRLREAAANSDGANASGDKGKREFVGCCVLSDPPFALRLRTRVGTVEFCDLHNYLRIPLEELAGLVGIRKHRLPPVVGMVEKQFAQLVDEARVVCGTITGLIDRWAKGNYGPWRITAAGLAWSAYEHTFGGRLRFPARDDVVVMIERAAYYGGRTVAWWTGAVCRKLPERWQDDVAYAPERIPFIVGPVTLVDVRQCYGWAMATVPTPVSFERVLQSPSVDELQHHMRRYGAIAVCRVNTDSESYVHRRNGITQEYVGEFWTALADPELRPAIERGHVERVAYATLYKVGRPLATFARHFLHLRSVAAAGGDLVSKTLARIMNNSLYGRHAMMAPRWVEDRTMPRSRNWGHYPYVDLRSGRVFTCRAMGSAVFRQEEYREDAASFPAVAAWITSAVREYLRSVRQTAGIPNTLLCRTDSLLLLNDGLQRLTAAGFIGDEPGQLRIVSGPTYDCQIGGPDHYHVGEHTVRVGVNVGAKEIAPGVYQCIRRERATSALSRGTEPVARFRTTAVHLAPTAADWSDLHRGWLPTPRLAAQAEEPMPLPSEMAGIRSLSRPSTDHDGLPVAGEQGLFD